MVSATEQAAADRRYGSMHRLPWGRCEACLLRAAWRQSVFAFRASGGIAV